MNSLAPCSKTVDKGTRIHFTPVEKPCSLEAEESCCEDFTVFEEISTLRNASYFLDNATRAFIENNNRIGCYSDELAQRLEDGLSFIHDLIDNEYKAVLERLAKEQQSN